MGKGRLNHLLEGNEKLRNLFARKQLSSFLECPANGGDQIWTARNS